jgi:hypothetical protein
MAPSSKPADLAGKPAQETSAPRTSAAAVGIVAWLVPGAGHFMVGELRKAAVFFVVLIGMFVIGLAFQGRLFPFQMSEPLVFLAAAAEWAIALPRLVAGMWGKGAGNVVVITYEYGNTFLIVSGLLNALVALDAVDFARGRKAR